MKGLFKSRFAKTSLVGLLCLLAGAARTLGAASSPVTATGTTLIPGATNVMTITLGAQGVENALGFSLGFDTNVLRFVGVATGSGAQGATMVLNKNQANVGKVGVLLGLSAGDNFPAGSLLILNVSFTTAPNVTGTDTVVSFTDQPILREVVDAFANDVPATFTSGVMHVDGPPTIAGLADLAIDQDTSSTPLNFTVGDLETPASGLVVAVTSSNPGLVANSGLVLGGTGANRTLLITPLAGQFGTANLSVSVTDADGATTSQTFALTVRQVNHAPALAAVPDQSIPQLKTLTVTNVATDSDLPAQTLTFSLGANAPQGASIDPVTGVFRWTPTQNQGPSTNLITVIVTDNGSPANQSATTSFTVVVLAPPSVSQQSGPVSTQVGGSATFSVVAVGTAPLFYQWQRGGINVPNATAASLALANVQASDAGSYSVIISNAVGTITNGPFTLTVNLPVSITGQPQSQSVNAGRGATLTVAASGSAPLSYQWQFNLANISGATNATLTIPAVQSADAGSYQVIVTNPNNSLTSAPATLTVINNLNVTVTVGTGGTVTERSSQPVTLFDGSTPLAGSAFLPASTELGSQIAVGAGVSGQISEFGLDYSANLAGTAGRSATVRIYANDGAGGSPGTLLYGSPAIALQNGTGSIDLTGLSAPLPTNGKLTWTVQFNGLSGADSAGPVVSPGARSGSSVAGYWQANPGGVWTLQPFTNGGSTTFSARVFASATQVVGGVGINPLQSSYAPGTTLSFSAAANDGFVFSGWTGDTAASANPLSMTLDANRSITANFTPAWNLSVSTVGQGTVAVSPSADAYVDGTQVSLTATAAPGWRFSSWSGALSGAVNPSSLIMHSSQGVVANFVAETPPTVSIVSPAGGALFAPPASVTVTVNASDVDGTVTQVDLYQGATLIGTKTSSPYTFNVSGLTEGSYALTAKATDNDGGTSVSSPVTITVANPPTISSPPQGQSVTLGATASFSVSATGVALSYQWQLNGTNLPNATASNLTIPNAQSSDAGAYQVIVSNVAGSVTSSTANLIVNLPVSITSQPQSAIVVVGGVATFTVVATGTAPLSYQWQLNSVNINNATNSNLAVNSAQTGDAGSYQVVVTNPAGSLTSGAATLTVNTPVEIASQPTDATVNVGGSATFSVSASGTAPLRFQWQFKGVNLPGATNSSLTINNAQTTDAGVYQALITNPAGTVSSSSVSLTVNGLGAISLPPASQTVLVGGTATFSVTASGTGPLSYQWQFNGTNIPNATSSVLVINQARTTDAGSYQVVVTSPGGSVTSSPATLTVNVPVTFGSQPKDATVNVGGAATFSVTANGTFPLSFQWLKNGTPVSGATTSTLTLNNAQVSDAAIYSVVVSNVVGAVTSSTANLTVSVPPTISQSPKDQTVTVGSSVSFSVTAGGTAPLSYQWQHAGLNLDGATGSSLILNGVTTADAGTYAVTVTNVAGTVTSAAANLVVNVPITLTTQPTNQAVNAGGVAVFGVTATGTAPLNFQWLFNGGPLPGATLPTLTISNVQPANVGAYSVVVSNVVGALTSSAATLTLDVPPVITGISQNVVVVAGAPLALTVAATGTQPLSYQWTLNGTAVAGATNSILSLDHAQAADAGAYQVTVTNLAGSAVGGPVKVDVNVPPTITVQPRSQTNLVGDTLSFQVIVTGTAPLGYQWFRNLTPIAGATNLQISLHNVTTNQAGQYTVTITNVAGSVTSDVANLVVNSPVTITTQPTNQVALANAPVSFAVVAAGAAPIGYQWLFNGNLLAGANAATFTIPSARPSDSGSYSVVVSNVVNAAVSAPATLKVVTLPSITKQPQGLTALVGGTAAFHVTANGSEPLAYQWLFGASPLPGATNSTLTLTSVQANQAGDYSVVVTNAGGQLTSGSATLLVTQPVAITAQPQSRTNLAGTAASFSVTAIGTAPLTYQWIFNGSALTGQTNATLAFSAAQPTDAGSYRVVVGNAGGSLSSSNADLTVNAPPTITKQPKTKSTVVGATSAKFSVTASGTQPLSYQWQFNGAAIAGQTNSIITLSNIVATTAGTYTVTVTNVAGSANSQPAILTVNTLPGIAAPPQNVTTNQGSPAGFSVTATGTAPLSLQWLYNGDPVAGATNASLSFAGVQPTNAGLYSVVVTNVAGSVVSPSARLTVNVPPTIARAPSGVAAVAGANAAFSVVANGSEPLSYQWRLGGVNLPGATSSTLTLTNVQNTQAGAYSVVVTNAAGTVTSAAANLTLSTPVSFTSQPSGQSVTAGANATFTAVATGSAPLTYQWRFFGVSLPGATNSSYTVVGAGPTNAGPYSVVAGNSAGSTNSASAQLTVIVPPAITLPPRGQTNAVGDTTSLGVVATGTAPLTYQWRLNGVNVGGATNATLALTNVQNAQAGPYVVVVSNAGGAVTSAPPAVLTVSVPPAIQTQPAGQTVAAGGSATFTVVASGTAPLSYQWRRNGASLSGQTNSTLTINGVQAGNLGDYSVLVVNSVGTVFSANATLGINLPKLNLADNFAASVTSLATAGSFDGGTNSLATKEQGEPNHAGRTGGHSVWFVWQAPTNGIMRFDTAGSSFDTVMAAYTGVAVNSLTAIGSDDDFGGQLSSEVQFNAVAGTVYHVAIDGASASSVGHIVLTFNFTQTSEILPQILSNPTDQTARTGGSATFTVQASPAGVTYQWFYNGSALGGQTSSNLTVSSVQAASAGPYTVRVTSGANSVDSAPANLQINDSSDAGSSEDKFSDLAGVTGGSGLSLASFPARLTPIRLEANGAGVASAFAGTQVFTTFDGTPQPGEPNPWRVSGGAPEWFLYQAKTNGVLRFDTIGSDFKTLLAVFTGPGTDFASLVLQGADAHSAPDGQGSVVSLPATTGTTYFVVVDGENGAKGHVTLNYNLARVAVITQQPAGRAALAGDNVTLSVVATNVAAPTPLSYQWSRNGLALSGATNSTLNLANVGVGSAGNYSVAVANFAGVVTSQGAQVSVGVALTITAQPQSQSVAPGSAVNLTVAASGTEPLSYQWSLGGVPLPSATNATLALANFQGVNAGNYTVVITNQVGAVTSAPAVLSVNGPPSITTQPRATTSLTVGGSATLSVTASSSSALTYQWRLNGVNIPGATNAALTLNNASAAAVGAYTVVVGNAVASVVSAPAVLNVSTAITIAAAPQDQTDNAGDTVTFTVLALGTAPLTYQWQFNGTNVTGATALSLTLTNVQVADAGLYQVVVANGAGSVTSHAATLTVNSAISITQQPQSQSLSLGGVATLRVTATGTGLTYQWRRNGIALAGQTNSTLTLNNVGVTDAGTYTVLVANDAAEVISAEALLSINSAVAILAAPQSQTVGVGGSVSFTVVASGSPPLSYQWRLNGVDLAGGTGATLTLNNVQTTAAGSYTALVSAGAGASTIVSPPATLTVNTPIVITQQPQSQVLVIGADVTFSVTAAGNNLGYQWRYDGVDLPGAVGSTLTVSNAQVTAAGTYAVLVSNGVGDVLSDPAVLALSAAPVIVVEPQSQSVGAGGSVIFSVAAFGSGTLSYQWRFNGSDIAGATNATYQVANVQGSSAGAYQVAVSNAVGVTLSSSANLAVNVSVTIVQQPVSQALTVGANVTFTVNAVGANLNYQWLFNSVAITGATNSALTLTNVTLAQAGVYNVIVSNASGAATSADAFLSQATAPSILTAPQSVTATVGGSASFSVVASGAPPLTYQWSRNGVNLPGATNSMLTLINLQLTDRAKYQVLVTNPAGSSLSDEATLLVVANPTFQLTAGALSANGAFVLHLSGPAGQMIQLQASTTLTNWFGLTNLVLTAGAADYVDVPGTNLARRFYRLAPAVPLQLLSATRQSNGQYQLAIQGSPGQNLTIQSSADLKTWTALGARFLTGTNLLFLDPQPATNNLRFYRVLVAP